MVQLNSLAGASFSCKEFDVKPKENNREEMQGPICMEVPYLGKVLFLFFFTLYLTNPFYYLPLLNPFLFNLHNPPIPLPLYTHLYHWLLPTTTTILPLSNYLLYYFNSLS